MLEIINNLLGICLHFQLEDCDCLVPCAHHSRLLMVTVLSWAWVPFQAFSAFVLRFSYLFSFFLHISDCPLVLFSATFPSGHHLPHFQHV